jgi:hypothetical protein
LCCETPRVLGHISNILLLDFLQAYNCHIKLIIKILDDMYYYFTGQYTIKIIYFSILFSKIYRIYRNILFFLAYMQYSDHKDEYQTNCNHESNSNIHSFEWRYLQTRSLNRSEYEFTIYSNENNKEPNCIHS